MREILRRIGVVIVQTLGGVIGTAAVVLILSVVIEAIAPYDYGESMCEYFCPGNAWIAILIAVPLTLTTSVWLIGRFFGQRGTWWLTGLGTLISTLLIFTNGIWARGLKLPPVLDIVVPVFAVPLLAALMYQASTLIGKQPQAVEMNS